MRLSNDSGFTLTDPADLLEIRRWNINFTLQSCASYYKLSNSIVDEGVLEMTTAIPRTTPCKNRFIFYLQMSKLCRSFQFTDRSKNLLRLNMQWQRVQIQRYENFAIVRGFAFSKIRRTWSFHVVVLQTTAKKCTKIPNAHAELSLFCSLNFCSVTLL